MRLRGGNSVSGAGTAASPLVVAEENNFHDANLQTNYYTVGRGPQQTWEPRFSHWGFRYMEIRNLEAVLGRKPDLARDAGRFRVKVARSGFERVGSFRSDNPLLQRINSNLEWAQQNNLVGKPTDTPSREKNGWTGDTMADSETQSLIWDVRRAHEKYLRSFPDGMISTGQLPMILPAAKGGYGYDRTPGWNFTWQAVPAWDSAFFVMPWEQYEQYGNTSLFAELYDDQDRLLRYYETLFTPANNYTFNASLGAYSGAEPAGSNAVISQQFYIYFADYMARVGRMIGKHERADYYAEKARVLRKSFVEKYWDEELGYFTQGSISSENTLAIEFGIVPGSDLAPSDPLYVAGGPTQAQNRARLAKLLADRIVAANHHIVNDMYGSRYEFNILDEYGYTDIALKAVTQTGAPGYVDQIAKGATSLWENWTGGSLNHHYRSNVATWFYQGLAGIQPTSPAYETVRVRPAYPVRCGQRRGARLGRRHRPCHGHPRRRRRLDRHGPWHRRVLLDAAGRRAHRPHRHGALQHRGRDLGPDARPARHRARRREIRARTTRPAGRPTRSTAPPWARTPSTAAPAELTPHDAKGRPTAGRPAPRAPDWCRPRPRHQFRFDVRSTARATSTREDAPSLTKMFRRCDSTVFSLRKSSAAISRLVLRAVTSSAISRSRRESDSSPPSAPVDGPRGSALAPSRRSSCRASPRSRSAPQASNVLSAERRSCTARVRSPATASARPASACDRAASIGAPAALAASADASARSVATAASPLASRTAARARCAIAVATGSASSSAARFGACGERSRRRRRARRRAPRASSPPRRGPSSSGGSG